jgi:hypothetical protein
MIAKSCAGDRGKYLKVRKPGMQHDFQKADRHRGRSATLLSKRGFPVSRMNVSECAALPQRQSVASLRYL